MLVCKVQDSDLEYLFWRSKNSPVSSDLKPPLQIVCMNTEDIFCWKRRGIWMRIPLPEQGHNLTYIINNLITYLPNRMRKWQFWKIMKQFPDPYFWDTPYKNRSYEIRLRFSWFWSNLTWKSNFKRRFELRLFLSYGLMGPKPLWSRIWIFTSFSYEGVPKISRLTNCRFKTISS